MMSTTQSPSLTVDELERLIKRIEPAAFLVPPRLLRRVIKQHRQLGGLALFVPHRKGYVIDRDALLDCVQPVELGLASSTEVPAFAFLMIRPEPGQLAKLGPGNALASYGRILFHLRIDHAMGQKLANGSFTAAVARQRVRQLGLTEFAEISAVLRQEEYLLSPESSEAVYAEFVAVYLTLRRFDPERLAHFFPALRNLAAVDALVAEDIDANALYHATRLTGADEPSAAEASPSHGAQSNGVFSGSTTPSLTGLVNRLKSALELSDADAANWREALRPLGTAGESWGKQARLLADLRGVCDACEHGIFTVDLAGWALSLGELPIKRPLHGQREVAILRHLRSALDRTRSIPLAEIERQNLTQVLARTLEQREHSMRARFRPLLAAALTSVGLKPPSVVEEVGRGKLIEELLDRIQEFGHFNIGNLRDALSRNQLKLPDLAGPGELVTGDPFIRLNRKLAVVLDGIYRRGEFYMRLFHRLSSVAFGTMLGRLLVLFLVLPVGLALFTLITPGVALEEGQKLLQLIGVMQRPAALHDHGKHALPLPNIWAVLGLALFYLLLIHVASFRSQFFYGLGKVARSLHAVFAYGVLGVIYAPALQALLHHPIWRTFRRCLLWPGIMAINAGLIGWLSDQDTVVTVLVAALGFVLGNVLLNTRVGRDAEEAVTDWGLRNWLWFRIDLAPGLLHMIMDASRWCLEGVEQGIYRVGEWLRFRTGENRLAIGAKAILGLFWFAVTYVLRFALNLLIEPQVNPIKHFPVVTVSHKVCLPMTPVLRDVLVARFALDQAEAWTLAGGIITSIPGIFGFMVWELKENWKLYAANRPFNLEAVPIGSHGETMLRLLRPGFHSGTIPKLFSRLRRAERRGQQNAVRKVLAGLHHVEESVRHFVERETLALLRRSRSWAGMPIELASVWLATNRVAIELRVTTLGSDTLVVAFDDRAGWLLAGVLAPGWLPRLSDEQRRALTEALAGLYKKAGVDLTREQVVASLPGTIVAFDLTDAGLTVWRHFEDAEDVVYDLNARPELQPQSLDGGPVPDMPVLDANRLLYRQAPLAWPDWVQTWDRAATRDVPEAPPAVLLPATSDR